MIHSRILNRIMGENKTRAQNQELQKIPHKIPPYNISINRLVNIVNTKPNSGKKEKKKRKPKKREKGCESFQHCKTTPKNLELPGNALWGQTIFFPHS